MLITLILILAADDALVRGQRAFQAGDLAAAETEFRAHLKAYPQSAEATSNLAAVLARREQWPEAITLYQKALRLNPKLIQVYFNLGVTQMRTADFPGCVASFDRFLKAYPQENRARQLLGLCRLEAGDLPGAILALEKVPADPSVLFSLAMAYARSGDENRATALLSKLESTPAQARLVEGLIDYRKERYAEARPKLEEALRLDPTLTPALVAVARLNLLEGQNDVAIPQFEQVLQRTPQDAESTYQLGVLYDRVNRSADARAKLTRALALRANYADPHYQLARIDFRERKFAEALAHLDIAVKILPKQEAIHLLLARTYQALGRKADADREFATVRQLKQETTERHQLTLIP
ncbi:MAG: tetratricopeptide repeat protein [Acidobacteria bacterium]|nr:tetratricopeptide repeat protein [Acidobacteriota bacterium]